MPVIIDIEEFLVLSGNHVVIDVRSPLEYIQGHIPNAINIPLFSDDERDTVGKIYKKEGREKAMFKALDIIAPSLSEKIITLKKHVNHGKILIHCWRGGMRSSSMAWLMELFGFEAYVLKNGYKSFRRYIHAFFKNQFKLVLIGGMTGSGKTELLDNLCDHGWQVLNLEEIANHKGSAFGGIGMPDQPSSEQFENEVFEILNSFNIEKPVIIEDESFSIGKVQVPMALYEQMQKSLIIEIDIPKEKRIEKLIKEYAVYDKVSLKISIEKINKRLGSAGTKSALLAVDNNDFATAADILLKYYDKRYIEVMNKREKNKRIQLSFSTEDNFANMNSVSDLIKKIYGTD